MATTVTLVHVPTTGGWEWVPGGDGYVYMEWYGTEDDHTSTSVPRVKITGLLRDTIREE